jgi:hypothetical protein
MDEVFFAEFFIRRNAWLIGVKERRQNRYFLSLTPDTNWGVYPQYPKHRYIKKHWEGLLPDTSLT